MLELFNLFSLFYYLNSRLPLANGHLFVPYGEKPEQIKGDNLKLKLLYEKFRGTKSNGLVCSPFICAPAIFLGCKEEILRSFLTEFKKNLSLKAISFEKSSRMIEFNALKEICAKINSCISPAISSNHERKIEVKMK